MKNLKLFLVFILIISSVSTFSAIDKDSIGVQKLIHFIERDDLSLEKKMDIFQKTYFLRFNLLDSQDLKILKKIILKDKGLKRFFHEMALKGKNELKYNFYYLAAAELDNYPLSYFFNDIGGKNVSLPNLESRIGFAKDTCLYVDYFNTHFKEKINITSTDTDYRNERFLKLFSVYKIKGLNRLFHNTDELVIINRIKRNRHYDIQSKLSKKHLSKAQNTIYSFVKEVIDFANDNNLIDTEKTSLVGCIVPKIMKNDNVSVLNYFLTFPDRLVNVTRTVLQKMEEGQGQCLDFTKTTLFFAKYLNLKIRPRRSLIHYYVEYKIDDSWYGKETFLTDPYFFKI